MEAFLDAHADSMPARMAEWEVDREEFVEEQPALSEGNFMYLVYVLPEIAGGQLSRETVGAFTDLPRGLNGYYRRHWRDMKAADPQRFARHQRPVLCFLAISREPVTSPQLMSWTALDPGAMKGVLGEWREFLDEDEGEAGRAGASTTAASPSSSTGRRTCAGTTSRSPRRRWRRSPASSESLCRARRYERRHLTAHLEAAGREPDLTACCGSRPPPATGRAAPRSTPGWTRASDTAKPRTGSPTCLRARRLTSAVGMECRYALLAASEAGAAFGVSDTLVAALVDSGAWTAQQGLAHVRRVARGRSGRSRHALPRPPATRRRGCCAARSGAGRGGPARRRRPAGADDRRARVLREGADRARRRLT